MTKTNAELEIDGMDTTSSLPAKPDELADIEPVLAEVQNQKTGEFEKVMISPHDIKKYICPTATLQELYVFMSICRHQGIDPISEAYFVKFGDEPGFTVMKYTVYMKRAMLSGVIKSLRHEFDDEENPTKITVYLERTDMPGEWVWTTYRSEVEKRRNSDGKVTKIWESQLRFMMTKCGYSQMMRFFCADVVGALPPTQEEMGGIPALNMTEAPQIAPPLEVESVEQLPEHEDLSALRTTYFGMIEGLFKDKAERKAWQLSELGVESVKDFTIDTYAKAWKAIAKLAGPPKATEAEAESATKDDFLDDGQNLPPEHTEEAAIDEDTRKMVLKNYVERSAGKFPDSQTHGDWREAELGQRDIDKLTTAQLLKGTDLFNKADQAERDKKAKQIEEEKKNTEAAAEKQQGLTQQYVSLLIELRTEYESLVEGVFVDPMDKGAWEAVTVGSYYSDAWDSDQLKTAILEMTDYKSHVETEKEFEELKLEYLTRTEGMFTTFMERVGFQKRINDKGSVDDWGIPHLRKALKVLDLIRDGKALITDTEYDIQGEDAGEASEGTTGGTAEPEADDLVFLLGMEFELYSGNNAEPDKTTIVEIKNETLLLLGDKTGRQECSFAAAREAIKDGYWKLTAEIMTNEQFKELKKVIADLDKYHNNLGSTPFRDRAQEITGWRPRGVRKYTVADSAKLIKVFTVERDEYLIQKANAQKELDLNQ